MLLFFHMANAGVLAVHTSKHLDEACAWQHGPGNLVKLQLCAKGNVFKGIPTNCPPGNSHFQYITKQASILKCPSSISFCHVRAMGHEYHHCIIHTDYVSNSHVAINICTNDGSKRNNQLPREMCSDESRKLCPANIRSSKRI